MIIKIVLYVALIIFKSFKAFKKAEKIICRPPNKFNHVFCPPGGGKTTLCAGLVKEHLETDKPIYSNVPIIGAEKIKLEELGKYLYENCTILIDEAGAELSNRNWMHNLNEDQIRFIKKHRHYGVDIWLFSQSYNDVDNKFRELTTSIIMLKKSWIPFRIDGLAIKKTVDLINGQIVEYFEWDKDNSFHYFTPKLWAYFNSYDKTENYEIRPEQIKWIKLDTIA